MTHRKNVVIDIICRKPNIIKLWMNPNRTGMGEFTNTTAYLICQQFSFLSDVFREKNK